jgi:hypothetical protein
MSRIAGFLSRLDSVLGLPAYDGPPSFVDDACSQGEGDDDFAQHIGKLNVRTSDAYVSYARERAHILRSACSHLQSILNSKSFSDSILQRMDLLSVILCATVERHEKDWSDAESLRLSSRSTVDELMSSGLSMEEIYGDEKLDEELRTLRGFAAGKIESESVWKVMAAVLCAYLDSARAFAYHRYLEEILASDLSHQEIGRRLAARFKVTDYEVFREDLEAIMHHCKTLTYLDLSCLLVGLNTARWREIVCDILHGLSRSIYLGNGVVFRVSTGDASAATTAMRTEETGMAKHTFELVFHVDGPNEMRIGRDACPAIRELFQSHAHAVDCGGWYVNETRIKQRIRADVRRHSRGCRDIVVAVGGKEKDITILFMVQFREDDTGYVIKYGFQDPLGQRRNVVRWPSRSFLDLWLRTLTA